MLEELRLRGLGVIEDAVLELGPGFTVITGETGAGKTMLLTGLELLYGGRADPALVRSGHARAEVDGRVAVDAAHPAAARVLEAGGCLDEGAILLSRTVAAEGRSRAFAGGRSVPSGVLTELGEELVAVHGQADQRGLLRPGVQRAVLDKYAGPALAAALDRYRTGFAELTALRRELHEVVSRRRERAQEADLLRHGLAEIEAVAPTPGEDAELRATIARLSRVDQLKSAGDAAHAVLSAPDGSGSPDALGLVAAARRALEEARGGDPTLDALATRLADISYHLSDVSADLAAYSDGVEDDPRRLEAAQQRLAALTTLTRKYAPEIDDVLQWAERAAARVGELDDDGRVEKLSADLERVSGEVAAAAAELSRLRAQAAAQLQREVAGELAGLAMPQATVEVAVRQRDDEHGLSLDGRRVAFGPSGIDEVEIQLVAHAGAPARPLHKGASGGELSRVMLAIEVVLAGCDPVPTLVFDEVDAGVGGRAAIEVGRRLAALARHRQVLVVTHLPQVAAFADRHLVVRKESARGGTRTAVHRVADGDRLAELARMLGGLDESATGREHAQELLDVAGAARAAG